MPVFNAKFAKSFVDEIMRFGYPVIYPPVLTWGEIKGKDIGRSWEKAVSAARKDPAYKFSLYVHFPFCSSRCLFCNCWARAVKDTKYIADYLASLRQEILFQSKFFQQARFDSIYIGGGTPSLMASGQLDGLFSLLNERFIFKKGLPISFDAHPNSLTENKIKILKKWHVNRVTLGVQTLDEKLARKLRRMQKQESIADLVRIIRKNGIDYINMDMIAGLPGQTLASFTETLESIIAMGPDIVHVNPYIPNQFTPRHGKKSDFNYDPELVRQMIKKKEELLPRYGGYTAQGRASSTRTKKAINPQISIFESPLNKSSILGLGQGAISYVYQEASYLSNGRLPFYFDQYETGVRGVLLDKDEEMRYYIIKFLRQGIDRKNYKRIFGVFPEKRFPQEFEFLRRKGFLDDDKRILKAFSQAPTKDFYLYSTIFFSPKAIKVFKDHLMKHRGNALAYKYYY